jgi:short-subunit dehydrogenase
VPPSQWFVFDLATYDGVQELHDAVRATGRPLDALAVNAGVGVSGELPETAKAKAQAGMTEPGSAGDV